MRSVVVTGASTGIGRSAASVLIGQGFRVFAGVRSDADAQRLSAELGERCVPLRVDVTDAAVVARAAETVAAAIGTERLAGLVNNAGIAVPGPLLALSIDDFRRQLEVNLIGQLTVTQAFAPLIGTDPARSGQPGRIVMMSSVGGRNAAPFLGPYAASKFALEGLSESLRRELMIFGIDVIVVAPGAIATPIWDKADAIDITPYAATPYAEALATLKRQMIAMSRNGLPPERVGRVVAKALTSARPCTRYTYAVAPEPLQIFLANVLPKRLVDRLIAKRLGLRPVARMEPKA